MNSTLAAIFESPTIWQAFFDSSKSLSISGVLWWRFHRNRNWQAHIDRKNDADIWRGFDTVSD
jgi:hypothetical protein